MMKSLSRNVFYALKCFFKNWWALKSLPSTDQLGVRKLGVWSNTLLPHVYWRTYGLDVENWETVIFIWNFSKSFGQKESRQYNSQIPTSFTLENGWEAWGDTDIQECIIRHPVDCIISKARKPRKGGSNISQSFFIAIFMGFYQWINEDVPREEAGTNGQKRSLRPTFAPPKSGVFLAAVFPGLLLPLSIWGGVLTVSWPRNPNFFVGEARFFLAKKSRKNVRLGRRTAINTGSYIFSPFKVAFSIGRKPLKKNTHTNTMCV